MMSNGQVEDASGCVCAPFSPEFDNFESGNRYGRGRGGDRRPLLTRPSACLPPRRASYQEQNTATFRRSHWSLIQSNSKQDIPLALFLQCYPFLIKPSFCYPRFVSFRLQVTFFRPPLHAPQYTPQQPPPFAYPCPSTLPFLWMGHELTGEPTLRRICPRIRAKRSHPQPCPDAKTNALLCVLRQPP